LTQNRLLLAVVILVLVVSGIEPADRMTWILEVLPVMAGLPVILATYRRFPLTPLAYWLLAGHALILMLGGHYTYAKVPVGFWLQDLFDLSRNHYDRIGHIAQGFVPAIVAREVLIRLSPLSPGGWLNFIVICICLAISAFYEMIEWWVAVAAGIAAEAFLATQGDIWDTQWDMFLALCGAITALLMLGRLHDRQLAGRVDADPGH
jgi:putative membrane protein